MKHVIDPKIKEMNSIQIKNKNDIWSDFFFQEYYLTKHNNMSSRDLDIEFNNDIRSLSKALSRLPESERKKFVTLISSFIELYIENKIEKEIDSALIKLIRF